MEEKDKYEREGWRKIGVVGVDAGLLMIGDPCYFMQSINEEKDEVEEDTSFLKAYPGGYHQIVDELYYCGEVPAPKRVTDVCPRMTTIPAILSKNTMQLNYKGGHAGLGVLFNTTWGDGVYNVYAKFDNPKRKAPTAVMVVMDDPEDEEDIEDEDEYEGADAD